MEPPGARGHGTLSVSSRAGVGVSARDSLLGRLSVGMLAARPAGDWRSVPQSTRNPIARRLVLLPGLKTASFPPNPILLPVGRDTLDEIHAAHAKGRFIPVNVPAGGCVFRVPATWHAVRPVNRLRRYITGRYLARSDRPVSANAMRLIENATAERRTSAGAARLQSFPAPLRELCSPEGLMVARVPRVVPDGPRL